MVAPGQGLLDDPEGPGLEIFLEEPDEADPFALDQDPLELVGDLLLDPPLEVDIAALDLEGEPEGREEEVDLREATCEEFRDPFPVEEVEPRAIAQDDQDEEDGPFRPRSRPVRRRVGDLAPFLAPTELPDRVGPGNPLAEAPARWGLDPRNARELGATDPASARH